MRPLQTTRFLATTAAISALLVAPRSATAVGDLDLIALSGGVKPNVVFLFDNSPSMYTEVPGEGKRIEIAGDAAKMLIEDLYPSDGSGGYTSNVRLGLFTFDWSSARPPSIPR